MTDSWRFNRHTTALLACLFLNTSAFAQNQVEYQPLETIIEIAQNTILELAAQRGVENVQTEVTSLDNRLRLPLCDESFTAKSSQPDRILGRTSVEVSCRSPKPWRIYVQVNATAERAYPVLASSLDRNSIIGADDLEVRYIRLSQEISGFVDNIELIIGKSTNRYIASGEPIRSSYLSSPLLVRRGQQIQLRYQLGQLEVTMAGIAQRDASAGQWIKVANAKSGALVDGLVNADGSISVP